MDNMDSGIKKIQDLSKEDLNTIFMLGDKLPEHADSQATFDSVLSGQHYEWSQKPKGPKDNKCVCQPVILFLDENQFPWVIARPVKESVYFSTSEKQNDLVLIAIDPEDHKAFLGSVGHQVFTSEDDRVAFSRDYEYRYHVKSVSIAEKPEDTEASVPTM